MAGRSFILAGVLCALVLVPVAPTGASAQCRLCEGQGALSKDEDRAAPIRVEIESGLSFDRLVLVGAGEGSATLRPDGTQTVNGSLGGGHGQAMVGSAVVRGEPGRMVRVDLPRRIELHSLTGASIIVEDIVSDLPSSPRIDSSGRLGFRFGGRLRVNGDADGEYRGDLPIMAEYL